MTEYLVAILLMYLFRFILFRQAVLESKSKSTYIILSLLPLTVISGFRGTSVGADTKSYGWMFNSIVEKSGNLRFKERIEPGYIYLNKLLSLVSSDPQVVIVFVAVFISICIGLFIYRYSKEPLLALLFFTTLGFFQFTLSGLRQTIAMGIILLCSEFIIKRRLMPFIILVLLAATFHKTSFLFLPAYFISNNALSKKNLLKYLSITILAMVFVETITLATGNILNYEYGIESTGNGIIFFLIVLIITIIGFIYKKNLVELDERNQNFLNQNYLSMLLWSLRLVTRTAERISFYFIPSTYMVLEEYLFSISNKKTRVAFYILVSLLCITLFIYRIIRDPTLTPYTFTDFNF